MQYLIYPCELPCEGGKSFRVSLDFSLDTDWQIDFLPSEAAGQISQIRSMYIDNLANNSAVTFTIPVSGQVFTIPANSQAYMPFLAPNPPLIQAQSGGAVDVEVEFLNAYLPPWIWGASISGTAPVNTGFLLLESGDFLLLESGDFIVLE